LAIYKKLVSTEINELILSMAELISSSNSMRVLGSSAFAKKDREQDDYYATDPNTVRLFLETIKKDGIQLKNKIWEPAAGEGNISKVLIENGYNVYSTDLIDRGYCESDVNFLGEGFNKPEKPKDVHTILTNPPYKVASEFTRRSLDLVENGDYVIMYLRVLFLEGKERYKLFKEHPPKYIYVHSSRQSCAKSGDFEKYTGSAVCFAWFIWEKGSTTEPIIRWII
jgi:hypothetical protein